MKKNAKTNATTKTSTSNKTKRIATREELPQCFLNEGESYTWLAKGGIPVEQRLPYVAQKYEGALMESGIPYRYAYIPNKHQEGEEYAVCEYWNPECPMQERTLPVYIKSENSDDMYVFTGDYITRQVISGKVAHLANKLLDSIKYTCAKIDLGGKNATVVRRSKKMPQEVNLEGTDGGAIKILQAYKENGEPTGLCAIFDMNEVAKKHYIELHVPKAIAGAVIGKGGQNKKFWDEALGGKNVVIVAE